MDDKTYNKLLMTGGAGAGLAAYSLGGKYLNKGVSMILNDKIKIRKTPQDTFEIKSASQKALTGESLDTFGVKIMDYSQQEGYDFIENTRRKAIENIENKYKNKTNKLSQKIKRKKIKKLQAHFDSVKNGTNAFFSSRKEGRFVIINMDKFPSAVFHELGHAKNHRSLGNKWGPIFYTYLRNKKYINLIATGIFFTSMFTNKKKDKNEKKKNPLYPIAEFIKNNCGKLTTLICIPLLAEETIASIRGQKIAKKYLPKANMKPVTMTHIHSFSSYARYAVMSGIVMYLSNLARDKYVEHIPKLKTKINPKLQIQTTSQKLNTENYINENVNMKNFLSSSAN